MRRRADQGPLQRPEILELLDLAVAPSPSTVSSVGETSANPPSTTKRCGAPAPNTVRMPGLSVATAGACPASTPKSPSTPETSTWVTSPEKTSFVGDTRSQ